LQGNGNRDIKCRLSGNSLVMAIINGNAAKSPTPQAFYMPDACLITGSIRALLLIVSKDSVDCTLSARPKIIYFRKVVCKQVRVNVSLPGCVAATPARAIIDRYLSPAYCCDGRMRQTDRRTPYRYIDPAPPTVYSLFHAHVPLSATEVSLSQDRVCGTVYWLLQDRSPATDSSGNV